MLFKYLAVALVPLVVSAVPVRRATAQPSTIQNFQLMNLFEKMQTQFYQDILKKFTSQDFTAAGSTDGATVTAELNTIGNEDATHAAGLDSLLQGAGQVALTCQFNLAGAEKDAATALTNARVIKQVVASTYVGIMNTIGNAGDLTQVNSQATVDSRHQSTLSILNGASGSPQAFETPILASEGQTILSNILTGCNTGIQSNPPLQITNTGLVTTGTKLTFSSTTGSGTTNTSNALTSSTTKLTCQLINSNSVVALDASQCAIPSGFNGATLVYITNSTQPLSADIAQRQGQSNLIVAGPALTFVDTAPDPIGSLVTTNPQ